MSPLKTLAASRRAVRAQFQVITSNIARRSAQVISTRQYAARVLMWSDADDVPSSSRRELSPRVRNG